MMEEERFEQDYKTKSQTTEFAYKQSSLRSKSQPSAGELSKISEIGRYFRHVYIRITDRWYFICEICQEEFQNIECSSYTNCKHQRNFCDSCLTKYVKFRLIFFEEIRCPKESCNATMDIQSIFFKNLPNNVQKRYRKISTYYQKLHDANFRTCPSQNCEGNITYDGKGFICTLCKDKFCLNCLAKEHKGECYMEEITFFKNILHYSRCPKCKFVVEKESGCNRITCRCKYEFCYKCNDTYTSNHRCQYDVNYNVVMKNPIIKTEEENKNTLEKPQEINMKSSLAENIFFGFSLVVVLIPLFLIFLVRFLLWIGFLGILEIVKLFLMTIFVAILGAGPFAYQYSKTYQSCRKLILTVGYPFLMIAGIYNAFKELFFFTTSPILKRYLKTVKKCWRVIFIDLLNE